MRSVPFNFAQAEGIHALITISKPTSTIRLTTANRSFTTGGHTFIPYPGLSLTSVQYLADGSPSNADIRISAVAGGPIAPGEAASGVLEGLSIKIEIFDTGDIAAGTFDMLPGATIGSVAEDSNNIVTIGAQGKLALALTPLAEQYTLTCKAVLGDNRCKVALDVPDIARNVTFTRTDVSGGITGPAQSWGRVRTGVAGNNSDYGNLVYECTTGGTTHPSVAPSYPTSVGGTVTDGTAVFTARNAFLRSAVGQALSFFEIQLTALPDPRASGVPPWFVLGRLIPRTGPLTGVKIPVRAFDDATFIVTLFEPYALSSFPAGTQFDIHRGCDLLISTCIATFNNAANIRATPQVPASDTVLGRG